MRQAEAGGLCDWRPVATVRLPLFTGARLSEALGLRWEWVDLRDARRDDRRLSRQGCRISRAPADQAAYDVVTDSRAVTALLHALHDLKWR